MTRKGAGKAQKVYQEALTFDGDECLEWPFSKIDGYAAMQWEGKKIIVSRLICASINGAPKDARYEAAHSCGNRACINGRHLSWKTSAENNRDKILHGTVPRGERHWSAKLSDDVVKSIISSKGENRRRLASIHGVSESAIAKAQRGETWTHLKDSAA